MSRIQWYQVMNVPGGGGGGGGGGEGWGQFFHGDNMPRSDTGISNGSRFDFVRCSVRTAH